MKKYVSFGLWGLLGAYAVSNKLHMPPDPALYPERANYLSACVSELLGDYSFPLLLLALALAFFFAYSEEVSHSREKTPPGHIVLACVFSLILVMGESLEETSDLRCIFGSAANFGKAVLIFAGFFLLLLRLLQMLFFLIERGRARQGGEKNGLTGEPGNSASCGGSSRSARFWSAHVFGKSFGLLWLIYGPVLLLAYPGNLCWDIWGQMNMILGDAPLTTHHPLLHTLLAGGLTKLGGTVLGSYEIGLFLYMLVQDLLFTAALASTVAVLAGYAFPGAGSKAKPAVVAGTLPAWTLTALQALYMFTPVYSNMASTAIKDIPFVSCFIFYMVLLTLLWERGMCSSYGNPASGEDPKPAKKVPLTSSGKPHHWNMSLRMLLVCFVLAQMGVILMRNNGKPLLVLSLVLMTLQVLLQGRKKRKSQRSSSKKGAGFGQMRRLLLTISLPSLAAILLGSAASSALAGALHAEENNTAEVLSLPVQQTARYLQLYQDELTPAERAGIEGMWGDVAEMAASYDPKIADPVKALYVRDASGADVAAYLKVWAGCFFKHPGVYFDAFFVHVYGWFDPGVSNSIRYETEDLPIAQSGLFHGASRLLIFIYRMLGRFTPLAIWENVGLYTWGLLLLTYEMLRRRKTTGFQVESASPLDDASSGEAASSLNAAPVLWPLYVTLLICMASPVFFGHPRYAFPIMFTLPYLILWFESSLRRSGPQTPAA